MRLGGNVWRLASAGELGKTAQREVTAATAEQERLKKKLEQVADPEYALGQAREKLGLGKAGEVVVILPDQQEPESIRVEEPEKKVPNWKQWWQVYVGI